MLSKVLKKETCAECRFCCSFRRCSLWETPLFSKEVMDLLEQNGCKTIFKKQQISGIEYGQMDLTDKYKTQEFDEEAACEFLDTHKGCTLSDDEKPFDCKIWPLRIMNKDGRCVIALTPTCPAINKISLEDMKALVQDRLGEVIYEYAKRHPYIIKEYKEGFPVLMSFLGP